MLSSKSLIPFSAQINSFFFFFFLEVYLSSPFPQEISACVRVCVQWKCWQTLNYNSMKGATKITEEQMLSPLPLVGKEDETEGH